METNLPPVLQMINDQLAGLYEERTRLVDRVMAIDEQIAKVARSLGIDGGGIPEVSNVPRLSRPDLRSVGTMAEKISMILLAADRGYTRGDLRDELKKEPKFADSINRNANTFYNNVARMLKTNRVKEVDTLLYHPDRAPSDDPDPQHGQVGVRLVHPQRSIDL